ncbi:MAG TPA: glycerol-3-phosphate dehydrogenase/oxidase [Pyrinomonadaceae bacterium]|jgi:glycerol-3-phosphate dehydrogenase
MSTQIERLRLHTSSLIARPRSDERERALARLERERFDLLVVGGGITGAAVAHAASLEGYRVALVEQQDFASGTSSRSSRLIHGGLRYLKQGQVRLVRRCLQEQQRLAQAAPHLVRPLSLLLPLYSPSRARLWAHRGGMALYRALQPKGSELLHEHLASGALLAEEPLLPRAGLEGGYLCREYLTHDARLVWETVLAASLSGACTLNYVRLLEFLFARGRVAGGVVCDEFTDRTLEVRARVVVNTTGPWSDRLTSRIENGSRRLRLTKGVHVILPRRLLPLTHGVIFFSRADKRPLVALPSDNLVVVGPTETEYEGEPGRAEPEPQDIEYLLDALASFFPGFPLSPADVQARAGLRPLYDQTGKPPGEVSRAYHIEWQREGLLSVLGGKLTLHAHAAKETLSVLACSFGPTDAAPRRDRSVVRGLPGALWPRGGPEAVAGKLRESGAGPNTVAHLLDTYGSRALLVADLLAEEPAWLEPVAPPLPFILAEAIFSMRYEMATCAQDFAERRTDLALRAEVEGRSPDLDRLWCAEEAAAESRVIYA